jgi:hypothetical protein
MLLSVCQVKRVELHISLRPAQHAVHTDASQPCGATTGDAAACSEQRFGLKGSAGPTASLPSVSLPHPRAIYGVQSGHAGRTATESSPAWNRDQVVLQTHRACSPVAAEFE